jgi:sugar O-acyltransferase (sialic acid O-acetyltransferase NeuD family)
MEKGRTIIVGAGGFGRELINWASDCHQAGLLNPVAGLIDDDPNVLNGFGYGVGLLGTTTDFVPASGDHLLMAISAPAIKERVAGVLTTRGGRFASLIHPRAVVAGSARIGEGAILCPLSLISADAEVGKFCTINAMSSVGHDVRLGDYSTLSAHVDLTGLVSVGRSVMIGSGAKVLPKVRIGDNATIGAGAIVYRSVPSGRTAYATPAKMLRNSQTADSASR